MKVILLATGTEGVIRPYLSLARTLEAGGFTTLLATDRPHESLVNSFDIEFYPLRTEYDRLTRSGKMDQLLSEESGHKKKNLQGLVLPMLKHTLDDCLEAAKMGDVLIYDIRASGGYHIAEALQLPSAVTSSVPLAVIRDPLPLPPAIPTGGIKTGALQKASHILFGGPLSPYHRLINDWRREKLKLYEMDFNADRDLEVIQQAPTLYSFSPHVIPPVDENTTEEDHIFANDEGIPTGFWQEEESEYRIPQDVRWFLEDGEPPVYVGFQGVEEADNGKTLRTILDGLVKVKRRAIICTHYNKIPESYLPSYLFLTNPLPLDWILPRCSSVLIGGSAYEMGESMKAGRPMNVIYFNEEQHWWGETAHRLGVSGEPMDAKTLKPERAARAVMEMEANWSISAHAAELRDRLGQENGCRNALREIKRIIGEYRQ